MDRQFKSGGVRMKKVGRFIFGMVAIGLSLVGCGNQIEPTQADVIAVPEVTTEDSTKNISEPLDQESEADIVFVGGPYGEISVELPENWSVETAPVDSNTMMYGLYGLILKLESSTDGQIELFCSDSFGVCGTGLRQEEATLAGGAAHIVTYDDHEHWDFITFGESRPQIVAQHTDCSSWTDDMWDEAMEILDTMKFDTSKTEGGIGQYIPESEEDAIAVMMSVTDVTPSGLTVHFRQYDKRDTEELTYGQSYTLQVQNGDTWENVPMIIDNGAFTDEGYILPNEGEAEMVTDWEWLYGKLSPGTYRITKTISDSRAVGNNPLYFLTAQFVIAG